MQHRLAARCAAACCLAVWCLLLVAPGARAAAAGTTSFRLLTQQPWVEGRSGVQLTLGVDSPLPAGRLGLKIELYSEVSTRDAFAETLRGVEPSSEVPIDSVPTGRTLPLAGLLHGGEVALQLPVVPGSSGSPGSLRAPTLFLDCSSSICAGVYPLQLVLFDTVADRQLATLTTYLIYAPAKSGALPLETALVLPLGDRLALAPSGAPLLDAGALTRLGALGAALDALAPGTVTVDLHPQLLTALSRVKGATRSSAGRVLGELRSALGGAAPTEEVTGSTFAPVSPAALAAAGLPAELGTQFGVARRVNSAILKMIPPADPYVSTTPVGPAALQLLAASGVRDVVIPPASLSGPLPAGTRVAPDVLAAHSPDAGGLVFAADSGLAEVFDRPASDPALAAMRFLAECSVAYFEAPFASVRRAVVVTPVTDGSSVAFLQDVFAGLSSSPILAPVTLGDLERSFAGAQGLATATLAPITDASGLSGAAVHRARAELAVLDAVVPAARAVRAAASDAVLLGEATGLSGGARRRYTGAPRAALRAVSRSLSLAGTRTVTLTARTGRVPVTITSQFPAPVNVVMEVRSSNLTFPNGTRFALQLTTREHSVAIPVRSLTSGATTLTITLTAPGSGTVLRSEQLSIHSTAISGVAIAISAAALAVLAAWWARAALRRRRGRAPRGGGTQAAT